MRVIVRAFLLGWSLLSFNTAAFSQKVDKSVPDVIPAGIFTSLTAAKSRACCTRNLLSGIFVPAMGEKGNYPSQLYITTNNSLVQRLRRSAGMRFIACGQTSPFVIISPQQDKSCGYWPFLYRKEWLNYAKVSLQTDTNTIYVTGLSPGGRALSQRYTATDIFVPTATQNQQQQPDLIKS